MSEVFKRDKKSAQVAQLYGVCKRDREHATSAMITVWKEQLAVVWAEFKELHDAVIDRSGAAECDEQQKVYDDTNMYFYKARMLLEDLHAQTIDKSKPATEVDAHLQLKNRHDLLIKRFELVCQRIRASVAEMSSSRIDIERADVEQLHTALREIGMQRMMSAADQNEVLQRENGSDTLFAETLELLSDAKRQHNLQANGNGTGDSDKLKVPHLQITPFDGLFHNWEAFRESFTHGIHSRTNMPAVQKLQYLKSVLRGEPEELIRNFGLTTENYQSAWKLLNDRYNNVRELVASHLRVLTSFSVCRESADDLRRLTNKTASSLLALQNLGRPIAEWHDWVVFHVCDKVDSETRRLWEQHQGSREELPTWNDLDQFLQGRIRALSASGCQQIATNSGRGYTNAKANKTRSHHSATTQRDVKTKALIQQGNRAQYVCGCCSKSHLITFCDEFRRLSASERRRVAAEKALCFICLTAGHQAYQCNSSRVCQTCNQKHNSLLHVPTAEANEHQVQANTASCTSNVVESHLRVLLATAIVNVRDRGGEVHKMRALLDQGSESSFVSERAADILQLPRRQERVEIVGLSGVAAGRSKQSITMCVSDRHGYGFSVQVHALIIPRVTSLVERMSMGAERGWPHLTDLVLADPEYMQSHAIDILLGSDVYGTLLLPGLRKRDGLPTAQNTSLGWILSGKVTNLVDDLNTSDQPILTHHAITVDDQLARFYELEETSSSRRHTAEEEKCDTFYDDTITRDGTGRLHVRLPMKASDVEFGESQRFAVQRQLQIERKFKAHPDFATQYRLFMAQYSELGHMKEVVNATVDLTRSRSMLPSSRREYYIPHHAVIKEASTTTKLRVVFDASRRTTNGVSLNDQMMVGRRLQDDLTAIMMRWRKFRITFCAEIEKMYRQIMVDEPDADLQRIVWRASADDTMKVYQLRTVTYGTASAPYLAIKSLQTLAKLEQDRFPVGAAVVLNHFYVDDVLSGADTVKECIESQVQLTALLSCGGFLLRKWVSNSEDVLAKVNPSDRESQLPLCINDGQCVSTLGIQWNPASDEIGFKINMPDLNEKCTKRTFLSAASRLYDPLGWLSPCIIVVKMLFQSLWKLSLDWDDVLPAELAKKWNDVRKALHQLKDVRISRWIGTTEGCQLEVHGFCDASMDAYAAVVYVRVLVPNQAPRLHNVCAKTRVAPVKVISLPRLELCGAQLLVKLIGDVLTAMQWKETSVYCWTDSTIVLAWLRGHPSRFNVFVANRTAEIQRSLPAEHWRHVVSADKRVHITRCTRFRVGT